MNNDQLEYVNLIIEFLRNIESIRNVYFFRDIEFLREKIEEKYAEFLRRRNIARHSKPKFPEAQYLVTTDLWYTFLKEITFQLRLRYIQHSNNLTKEQIVGMLKTNSEQYDRYLGKLYKLEDIEINKNKDRTFLLTLAVILDLPYHVVFNEKVENFDGDEFIEYKLLEVPITTFSTILDKVQEDLNQSFSTKKMHTSKDRYIPLNREVLHYLLINEPKGEIHLPYEASKIPLRVDARENELTSYEMYVRSDHIICDKTMMTLKKLFKSELAYSIPAQFRTYRKLCFLTGNRNHIKDHIEWIKQMTLSKIYT